jgi:hypothetical protein
MIIIMRFEDKSKPLYLFCVMINDVEHVYKAKGQN